jgi:hypothetical protein
MFIHYIDKLPDDETLIYCADDKGAGGCGRRLLAEFRRLIDECAEHLVA